MARVGATVACPRCKTALIVPAPDDEPEPDLAPPVEPEEQAPVQTNPVIQTPPAVPPAPQPEPGLGGLVIDPDPISLRPSGPTRPYRIPERARPAPEPPPEPAAVPEVSSPIAALTTLDIEPSAPGLREQGPRRDDVIMPRSAMLVWSFVMVLSLILAFAAGVLSGHFLWVASPPVAKS